ncbi:MAG: hypothetical protein RLZZ621_223 [Gemmatimonadota bacterium]|jgi:hypothetical protein
MMRFPFLMIVGMSMVGLPRVVVAQRPGNESTRERRLGTVPRDVALEVTRIHNAPSTRRVRGDFVVSRTDTIRSALAVLDGSLRLEGVVMGDVVVLNGDVRLVEGSRLDQSLTIIGGALESPDRPQVAGAIRVWGARYRYRDQGDTLVAETDLLARWTDWSREKPSGGGGELFVTTAHTYNRVEGLPVLLGPRLRIRSGSTAVRAEALGILRTGDGLAWNRENLGHLAHLEIRQGATRGLAVGGRLFDVVDAVESWQLSEAEVGLATFLFKRDYRDYWERHGGEGYLSLFVGSAVDLRVGIGEERWITRRARDPFTLFGNGIGWRFNPDADEGVVQRFTLGGTIDTRSNSSQPRAGWYIRGEYERAQGTLTRLAASTFGIRDVDDAEAERELRDLQYGRLLVDARRYTRLGPASQLNVRAVFGGWMSGDRLPMQRRLAVSGLDALPGTDFRRVDGGPDVGTCATGDAEVYRRLGRPAQCDRVVLAQVEWRGDFRISLFGDADELGARRWSLSRMRADGVWVLFANSGRGWLVGSATARPADQREATQGLWYPNTGIPAWESWRTDVGGGFDFGSFGLYVAKNVRGDGGAPNVYLRLGRRF